MHLRQRILCNLLVLRLVTSLISLSIPLLCLGSCSSVREQARGHRGNVHEPTPDQLMSFPESVFGFNKLGNQDLFVRGHAGVQANDANSQETKSEISLDMLVQGQKGEQHEIGGSDTSDAVIERHGSLDSKARSGETLETQELTSVDFVWADGKNDGMNENDRSSMLYLENENFELWKIVKDGLVLPLLIDICKKVGLFLPPCLMRLPTELKLKILESLAAIDIAKMESVSSEMQCLSSNNDPWQQKFVEEFGDGQERWELSIGKSSLLHIGRIRRSGRGMSMPWQDYHQVPPFFFPTRRNFAWYSSTQWSSWSRISSISLKFCSKL